MAAHPLGEVRAVKPPPGDRCQVELEDPAHPAVQSPSPEPPPALERAISPPSLEPSFGTRANRGRERHLIPVCSRVGGAPPIR
ncbi:hypothetical protein NDU88_000228 [Pleurodeles waltl]|uniref:Uncharacterized protein n=1 Tax=Pleurodeles waltl TaxID=8319 RepID=A0AAV7N8W1_PLEWA|nr:hypothetical protein NDU88_000228 [Pleurodeles waltl]